MSRGERRRHPDSDDGALPGGHGGGDRGPADTEPAASDALVGGSYALVPASAPIDLLIR
jgi:hypothetical protein